MEHGLQGTVEFVVCGLRIRGAEVGEDFLEEEGPQRFARRRDEDGKEDVKQSVAVFGQLDVILQA